MAAEPTTSSSISAGLEDCFPAFNPLDNLRAAIAEELSTITGIEKQQIFAALSYTAGVDKGDLSLAVPRFRVKGKKPDELAKEWADKFSSSSLFSKPTASGISIRFDFDTTNVASLIIPQIFKLGSKYGLNPLKGARNPADQSSGKQKIMVEFSSPNIAKEFHAGHLRSTIIGAFLSNLYEGNGWDVVRMNYLGDWGRQYGLLAIGWKKYGNEEAFAANPIGHLFDVYVKISAEFRPEEAAYKAAGKAGQNTAVLENQGLLGEAKSYFKRMEDGDEEALALWRKFRTLSVEKYKLTYARLNIIFSDYSGESQVRKESMELAEKILREKGISEIDQGASVIDFRKHGAPKLEVAILRNRNGTSNYLLRDIGAAIQRSETYNPDSLIYVVMSEQDSHLRRLFKILELMGGHYAELSKNMQHVTFGKVMGMSTRRGQVKFLDDILADVGQSMHEVMRRNEIKYKQVEDPEKIADTLGISAVMVQDMAGKRINNYPFSIERMTSFEGDTGPYLQYAHARLCSIARKADIPRSEIEAADLSLLTEKHATDLVRLMALYPDMMTQTLKTLEPTTILTYLFKLTHQLSSGYDVLKVVGAPSKEVAAARSALFTAAQQVLSNGMRLLGLSPVERM